MFVSQPQFFAAFWLFEYIVGVGGERRRRYGVNRGLVAKFEVGSLLVVCMTPRERWRR